METGVMLADALGSLGGAHADAPRRLEGAAGQLEYCPPGEELTDFQFREPVTTVLRCTLPGDAGALVVHDGGKAPLELATGGSFLTVRQGKGECRIELTARLLDMVLLAPNPWPSARQVPHGLAVCVALHPTA